MKNLTVYDIKYWTNKNYTEDEAIILIEKNKKENSCWNKEFWIVKKGFTEEEAIAKVKEFQSKNSKRKTKYTNNYDINTWIDKGYTNEDALNRVNELKLKANIFNILDDDEISSMMDNRRKTYYSKSKDEINSINKSRGRTKEQLIDKFGVEYTDELLKKRGEGKRNYFGRFSKISKKFFDELQEQITEKLYYAEEEKWIRYNKNNGYYVDLIFNNKIIEFNGDFYHANPTLYEKNDIIKIANDNIKMANDIWQHDKDKIDMLTSLGYDILIIWEHDITNNRQYIIDKCIQFLKTNKT